MSENKGNGEHDPTHMYIDKLVNRLKPGASYKGVKGDLDRASKGFQAYNLSATPDSELEKGFNKAAAAYIGGLYGIGFDDPTLAGSDMKNWLQKVGEDGLARAKAAIKVGNRTELMRIFEQAYEADKSGIEPLLAEVREQPQDVRMGFYGGIAGMLAGVNGYTAGDAVKVSENAAAAVGALRQRLTTAENFSAPSGGHGSHGGAHDGQLHPAPQHEGKH